MLKGTPSADGEALKKDALCACERFCHAAHNDPAVGGQRLITGTLSPSDRHYMSQRYDQELRVFDTRTGERSGPANVTRNLSLAWECEQRFDLYTAPGAPNNLRAAVSGRDLTLAWENIGAASGFILEAGFAPGRPALSVHLGPDSTGSFANVPPGTYYVRLRGFNEFGGGRPSNEIRLDIP